GLDGATSRLSMVIDNTTDAVVFADSSAVILEWNQAAEKLFGFTRDEVRGRSALELFVRPENVTAVTDAMTQLVHRGGVHEFTITLEPHGEPIAVALQIAAVTDAYERVIGFVTVARDDTRQQLTHNALTSLNHLEPATALQNFAYELRAFVPFDVLSL